MKKTFALVLLLLVPGLAVEKVWLGIMFIPPQEDRKTNSFMFSYVKEDGKALDHFDPLAVSYQVHFKAL